MSLTYIDKQHQAKMRPEVEKFLVESHKLSQNYPVLKDTNMAQFQKDSIEIRLNFNQEPPALKKVEEHVLDIKNVKTKIRIYYPDEVDLNTPTMCYLHGGGWVLYSIDSHDYFMRKLAIETGMIVVGIDYHLAPQQKYPYQIHQIKDVILHLAEFAQTYKINPNKLCLGGDSAGANLAVATMLHLKETEQEALIKAMLLIYGVYDNATQANSYELYSDGQFALNKEDMAWFVEQYLEDESQVFNPDVSPIYAELDFLPPCFMPIAELDILQDENVDFYDHITEQGVDATANLYYGTTHGFLGSLCFGGVSEQMLNDFKTWMDQKFS